jgi:hypothetical protein
MPAYERDSARSTKHFRPGGSAIDVRTAARWLRRHEECFGWLKDIALLRNLKHRCLFKVAWILTFAAAAHNLVRMRKLIPIPAMD